VTQTPGQHGGGAAAYAAKHPAAVNLGTLGEGSLQTLFLALLNREWGTSIAGIPYKGGGPIANALLGGEIQIGQMDMGNVIGRIQGGKLRSLAISASRRSGRRRSLRLFSRRTGKPQGRW